MGFATVSKLELLKRANRRLRGALKSCRICPRRCGADRTGGGRGYCRAGLNAAVYSYLPHHGEEPPLSGTKGSGTIFFSHCNMKCVYCQNYYFSQLDKGEEVESEKLARMMLHLEKDGCHNINLVSPTHFVPQILMALEIALAQGLALPIVYNTGGYDLPETVKLLDGIIDIYLADMRYSDDEAAKRYSDAPDYVKYNTSSVIEMQGQVGDLVLDENGMASRGLIIRLLALPADISGLKKTLRFIKDNISKAAYLSIMSQYYPTFKAYTFKELSRGVTGEEYENIVDAARLLGLNNGWVQDSPQSGEAKFFGTNIPPKMGI